jgi:uncharacterized damage-inducible protein DinB
MKEGGIQYSIYIPRMGAVCSMPGRPARPTSLVSRAAMPRRRLPCLRVFVHTAHHRAQCEVYMQVKGIKPPSYTF